MKATFKIIDPGLLAEADPGAGDAGWVASASFSCLGETRVVFPSYVLEDNVEVLIRAVEIKQSINLLKHSERRFEHFRFYFECPLRVEKVRASYNFFYEGATKRLIETVDQGDLDRVLASVDHFLDTEVRAINSKAADYILDGNYPEVM